MDRLLDKIKGCSPWALLPPAFSIGVATGIFVVYVVALAHDKVVALTSEYEPNKTALPPYISVAGNSPPASCIFTQVMNIGAFAGIIIAVFRYLQLKKTLCKPWLNNISFLAFSIGCFGMTLIGNFQLFAEEEIHNFGTFLTFGLGILFCWIQSYITLKVNFRQEGFRTSILRFLLSGGVTVCFILHTALMSQGLHMHASRSQWSLVMLFLIFVGTFCVEFRHSRMSFQVTDVSGEPASLGFTEISTQQSNSL
ncbi:hypothetical protein WMY93_029372 [Mugilogobius chulae]|uniref:CWH43-like N-terminal domain-containing protein n=1 Tax=Mugilogobius chulae TaxID=88201 RepID=A0AAW0MXR9_9GOBI